MGGGQIPINIYDDIPENIFLTQAFLNAYKSFSLSASVLKYMESFNIVCR